MGKLDRRMFLKAVGAGIGGSVLSGIWGRRVYSADAAGRHPNIVFMFSDDQRWDTLGCVGNPVINTPEHDRLAREGVLFENCFVTTSICCVSRANVFTGQYARRHGIDDFFKMFSNEQWSQTYPALLRRRGYWTGFIGKWGIGANEQRNMDKASGFFDFWAGGGYQTNYWHERDCPFVTNDGVHNKADNVCTCPADARGIAGPKVRVGRANIKDPVHQTTEIVPMKVRRFLESRDRQKPFCLSISFKSAHGPWGDYPEELKSLYEGVKMPIAATVTPEESDKQPGFLRNSLANNIGARLAADHEKLSKMMRDYYRLITAQDQAIGEIRKALAAAGVAENTVIIFTSDNGHFLGEHGFFGKWFMHEESIRVPCIIYDPRLPAGRRGRRRKEMILNIDFAPTMLELAGLGVPAAMQGRSLMPLMTGAAANWRKDWFYEHVYNHNRTIVPSEGVRTGEWKYIRHYDQEPVYEQLFHLKDDPHETHDFARDPACRDTLEKLRRRWRDYCRDLL